MTKIAGVLLAVLLVTTGVAAALPGNAPAAAETGQTDEYENESADEAADEADDKNESADEAADEADDDTVREADESPPAHAANDASTRVGDRERGASASGQGPPVDLPSQVPDFVSEIHQLISDSPPGEVAGDLGAAISDLTSSGEPEGM